MSNPDRSVGATSAKNHNRVAAIMIHTSRYSCFSTSRLAADSGISKSTISHLLHGRTNPLYSTVARVVKCLERELRRPLNLKQVFSETGKYPTRNICKLVHCRGCIPVIAFNEDGSPKPGWEAYPAGQWAGDTLEFESLEKDSQERST